MKINDLKIEFDSNGAAVRYYGANAGSVAVAPEPHPMRRDGPGAGARAMWAQAAVAAALQAVIASIPFWFVLERPEAAGIPNTPGAIFEEPFSLERVTIIDAPPCKDSQLATFQKTNRLFGNCDFPIEMSDPTGPQRHFLRGQSCYVDSWWHKGIISISKRQRADDTNVIGWRLAEVFHDHVSMNYLTTYGEICLFNKNVSAQLPFGGALSATNQFPGGFPKEDGSKSKDGCCGGENERAESNPKFIVSRKEAVERGEPFWPAIAAFFLMAAPGVGVMLGCSGRRRYRMIGLGIGLAWSLSIVGVGVMVGLG